jgi:hypothetical protein
LTVSVKSYLLHLTTRRAVHLFIGALLLGTTAIAFDIGLPWLPALIVALYGSVLLYTAKVYVISHSEMTNNSPYFLGFLLFLISLMRTFAGLSFTDSDSQVGFIIHQLGAALSTTIVGLPFRQLLFAYSPAQADQDLFFRTLEEELRRSATEFKKSQAELVQLVQEFVEVRKSLFSDEEKASRRYIKNLEKAVSLFDNDLSSYPTTIAAAIGESAKSANSLMGKLHELSQAVADTDPAQVAAALNHFAVIKGSATDLSKELQTLSLGIEELRQSAHALPAAVKHELQVAQSEFNAVRQEIRKQLQTANEDFNSVRGQVMSKVQDVQKDIDAIDQVLTEFVDLTERRVESTG